MKNLLIFLFGAACGVGGTLLWLRKDIKKELDNIRIDMRDQEVPFSVSDSDAEKNEKKEAVAQAKVGNGVSQNAGMKASPVTDEDRTKYRTMINDMKDHSDDDDEEDVGDIDANFSETDGCFTEIDMETYMANRDSNKEDLVYYKGDGIMCTENGTKIERPALLVGGEWENCVGNYANRTAFIHNGRLNMDYQIYVEDGFYADEFGDLQE